MFNLCFRCQKNPIEAYVDVMDKDNRPIRAGACRGCMQLMKKEQAKLQRVQKKRER